jgi:hypothetical protein
MIADSAAKSAGNRQTGRTRIGSRGHGASQLSAATGPRRPPIATTDLAVSIGALILTVAFGVVAAAMGLFSLAFLDYCPPESCSTEGAATAVSIALLAAFVIGVVGLVVTVIQLYLSKPGWPFAVATFTLCALAVVLEGVGYAMAVGA